MKNIMDNRLPKNDKEGLIYGLTICLITCILMATMNIAIGMGGLTKEAMITSLKCIPLFTIIALLLENFVVGKIAGKLVAKFSSETDSFNAKILFTIFFTVIGMSMIMTLIGGGFGHGFNLELIKSFPTSWPRNFCVAFFIEMLIAQPVARKVMTKIHKGKDNNIDCEVAN